MLTRILICCCLSLCKDTNLKAIHNKSCLLKSPFIVVLACVKIQIWKQFTTNARGCTFIYRCLSLCKDTNLKAIHNLILQDCKCSTVVLACVKIQIWKQFTTVSTDLSGQTGCLSLCKDTNLKAIHNLFRLLLMVSKVVLACVKIQIWKQFTTYFPEFAHLGGCLSLCKDTNLKAIHN